MYPVSYDEPSRQRHGNYQFIDIIMSVGSFLFSGMAASSLSGYSSGTLIMMERGAWWLHITGIFIFLNYLPYSKHLHIIFAFPNAY